MTRPGGRGLPVSAVPQSKEKDQGLGEIASAKLTCPLSDAPGVILEIPTGTQPASVVPRVTQEKATGTRPVSVAPRVIPAKPAVTRPVSFAPGVMAEVDRRETSHDCGHDSSRTVGPLPLVRGENLQVLPDGLTPRGDGQYGISIRVVDRGLVEVATFNEVSDSQPLNLQDPSNSSRVINANPSLGKPVLLQPTIVEVNASWGNTPKPNQG